MANQALIDYIMHQRVHGASPANIKNALLHAGWEEGDIEKGLKETEIPLDLPPPPPQVIIKPDQSGGAAAVPVTDAVRPTTKRPPLLAIALLVISILVVGAAAIFVYVQFLRPQPVVTKEAPPKATTTASPLSPETSAPEGSDTVPVNSEGGMVQEEPLVTETDLLSQ